MPTSRINREGLNEAVEPARSASLPYRQKATYEKVFPLPTVGAPSASNSPSALSAQALRINLCWFQQKKNVTF